MHKLNQALAAMILLLVTTAAINFVIAADEEPAVFGPETRGCRFAVATDRASYRFDQPIPLRFVLKNVGKEPVTVNFTAALMIYRFDVRGPNGKQVPLTLEGKHQANIPVPGENWSAPLDPGRSNVSGIAMLNRLYDMTRLGEYTVTAYRKNIWQKGDMEPFEVPSNTLKIVVRHYNAEEIKARQQRKSDE